MGISILSLFENNIKLDNITVYIIDDEISIDNKEKLLQIAELYKRKLIFLDMSIGIKKLREMEAPLYRGSYTTYLKIFAFNLLPNNVHRIFFIDSDSLVVGKLDDLDNFNMRGNPIAAVMDNLSVYDKQYLGYNQDAKWFNMGVMLIDVDKWKELYCEQLVIEQMKKRCAYVAVDQNLLNIGLHGRISVLNPRYNITPHYISYSYRAFLKCFPQPDFYSEDIVKKAIMNPTIHHFERFIGESPWHKNSVSPYVKEFDYYLSLSPWKNYKKKPALVSKTLKIEKILYKLLPKDIFLIIYTIAYRKYILQLNNKLEAGIDNINE